MKSEFLYQKIITQLKQIGVDQGDVLLVRANLGAIGKPTLNRIDYVNAVLSVIGKTGTLVSLAFTKSFFFRKNKNYIFDSTNESYAGSFANIMLSHPDSIRSKHPTNSFVAIGKNAKFILEGHDENTGAYEPIRKIISLKGKMILIGCASSSPGYTTVHLAETDLNLHKKIIFPWLNNCYFKNNDGKINLFKKKDIGGCSNTYYKYYTYYVLNNILYQGFIGNAYSIMTDAKKAYEIEKEILIKNPKFNICDNPNCFQCRARRWDNLKDIPLYLIRKLLKKLILKKN